MTIDKKLSQCIQWTLTGQAPATVLSVYLLDPLFRTKLKNHGLLPFIYGLIDSNSTDISSLIVSELRSACEDAIVHYEYAAATLVDIADTWQGGRIVLLQGMAINSEHCADNPVRPMGDVDVYLPDGDAYAFCQYLSSAGFLRFNDYRFLWSRNGLMIDVHSSLWGEERIHSRKDSAYQGPMEFVSSRLSSKLYVPAPLYLSAHCLYHTVKHCCSRAVWLRDCAFLAREQCWDTNRLGDWPMAVAMARCIEETGIIASQSFSYSGKTTLRQQLAYKLLKSGDERFGEVALALFAQSLGDTIRYIKETILPEKIVLEEMYGKKSGLVLVVARMMALVKKGLGKFFDGKKVASPGSATGSHK